MKSKTRTCSKTAGYGWVSLPVQVFVMIFDRFTDEADFRSRFVRPLLTRLGFVAVAELHGTQEFGKDFVFSELTPFGFLRHYGAVVKHEKTVNQSTSSCSTILSQVRQAFSVEFRLPDSADTQRVSSVVVFNSGKITENARNWIRSELGEERYGRNVHVLDGERLYQLDLTTTFRLGEQFLPRLQGIENDIVLNLQVWHSISTTSTETRCTEACFTAALESFLGTPFLADQINPDEVACLVQECRIIDRINQRHLMTYLSKEVLESDMEVLRRHLDSARERGIRLRNAVLSARKQFRLLTDPEPPASITTVITSEDGQT